MVKNGRAASERAAARAKRPATTQNADATAGNRTAVAQAIQRANTVSSDARATAACVPKSSPQRRNSRDDTVEAGGVVAVVAVVAGKAYGGCLRRWKAKLL